MEVVHPGIGNIYYPGYLLRMGSRGNDVLTMQRYLNEISNKYPAVPRLAQDGIFGQNTLRAVIAFQREFGLVPDGIIGPITWNAIIDVANSDSEEEGEPGNEPGNTPDNGSGNAGLTADELEVLNLINQQRANNGLNPLQIDPEVQNVARIKSQDMVDNNYFSHASPTYGSPFQMLDRFGVTYRTAGENIAGNSSNSDAVNAWMNSEGHRANILNGSYNYTGIGVVNDPRYGKIYTQLFIGR